MTRTNFYLCICKYYFVFILAAASVLTSFEVCALEFTTEPVDTVVQNGHSAVLDCVVKAADFPASTIHTQWLDKDRHLLTFIGDPYRSQLTNDSLYISNVIEEQGLTGTYQCMASLPNNEGTIVSRTARLSLASLSGFQKEPRDLKVYVGQKAHFSCLVQSSPPPRIKWLKDERPLQVDELRMTILPSGAIEIDEVKESDQGSYRCNASGLNSYKLSNKASLVINGDHEAAAPALPSFIAFPHNEVVVEGQTVTLDCAANGNPNPIIKWLKDGYYIDMADLDSRFSLVGSTGSLKISNIIEEDAGAYQCRAENREDSSDATATIQVQVPPKFLKKPKDTVEVVNNDVELECSVYGKPEPKVYWMKNGDIIITNEYYQLVNGHNLKIMGLMTTDSGLFQCIASNTAGNVQTSASLKVVNMDIVTQRNRGKKQKNRKKHQKQQDQSKPFGENQSRALFGSLKPETSDAKLGDVNFGHLAPPSRQTLSFNSNINNKQYDPHYIFTSLQSSDSDNLGDVLTAFTESFPTSKPFIAEDTGLLGYPGPPQDLKALIVKARFVVLSWKPPLTNNDDIITYGVYYRQEGSLRERVQNTTISRLEEINVGSLQPAKVYHFRVVAYNSYGHGESSESLSVTTQSEENVPSAPTNFTAYPTSERSIHCAWDIPEVPNGVITGYKIYYMELSDSIEFSAETTNTKHDIISLRIFTKYSVWVVALNNNGPGAASAEQVVATFGSEPSEAPYNVTLEPASSTSIIVRWEPPSEEGQNGVITGYKLKYRVQGKKGVTITTPGNLRIYPLNNLERGSVYQVKLWAMNINGTGPSTDWYDVQTYENDLDESKVPEAPSPLKVRPFSDKIFVMWSPPQNQNIKVRNYILGYGKGIPDNNLHELEESARRFLIERLEPNSEYVISLRASNEIGAGPPVYANVRTMDEPQPEPSSLIPPVGLKAHVLSSSSVVLYWVDTTLSKSQLVRDSRFYEIKCVPPNSGKNQKARLVNSTTLNIMINDLKPNTLYEFAVRLVKGSRSSPWSMVVSNTTWDFVPRELSIQQFENNAHKVKLTWLPPKQHAAHGYIIMYTTDLNKRDREWKPQVVKDGLSQIITDLEPSSKYYFKIQARNSNRVYGPFSSVVSFQTGLNVGNMPPDTKENKDNKGVFNGTILLILVVVGCVVALITITAVIAVLCCRRRETTNTTPDRSKKGYQKGNQNIKPPDLWIHHDQMELKNLEKGHNNDGASSSGAMTLPRNPGNDFDDRDNHTNSLDKRTYVPNYMGLSPDHKIAVKSKPINLPVDSKPAKEPIATATPINSSNLSQTSSDSTPSNRPSYPRTQYTISRAHVTLDQNAMVNNQPVESPYASHTPHTNYDNNTSGYVSSIPPPIAHIPPSSAYAPGMGILAESQAGKRIPAPGQHPLKSFTVPAPPPVSAPGTPQPKHVVTPPQLIVRPNASPYKKPPSSASSITSTPPSRIANNPPPHTVEEVQRLQPSHSTEELNQEMANLEGLMMTLNAITANEFEC